jgi:rare lipoprotein A
MIVITSVPTPCSVVRDIRLSRALACGALLSSMLLASHASNAAAPQTPARSAKTKLPAVRATPPFYDELGKRYYIRESSDGYRESGIASWYGRDFHGRLTSSGERYDMDGMTAAHPTLPIPTWVEVTNLSNGKHVIVKVNDRGPFVDKRLIDLSRAAASALDMVRAGTARVEVRALDAPPATSAGNRNNRGPISAAKAATPADEPVPPKELSARRSPVTPELRPDPPRPSAERPPPSTQPPASTRPSPSTPPEKLFAQAGKFSNRDNAVELVDTLKSHGFVNAFVVTEDGRRKSSHRVRVGPLADATELDRVTEQLRELGAKRSQSVVMN